MTTVDRNPQTHEFNNKNSKITLFILGNRAWQIEESSWADDSTTEISIEYARIVYETEMQNVKQGLKTYTRTA